MTYREFTVEEEAGISFIERHPSIELLLGGNLVSVKHLYCSSMPRPISFHAELRGAEHFINDARA